MEVIQYEEPRSWDDFGMGWNDPDPRCAHYMMALRNAFFERMAAAASDVYMYSYNVQRLSVWKTVTIHSAVSLYIKRASSALCPMVQLQVVC